MSATGCGFPTPLGSEVVTCGTRLLGLGDIEPVLCVPCLNARAIANEHARRTHEVRAGATCEGCREVPATRTTSPFLCDACEAEYAADMASMHDLGEPGSQCGSGCGYCGRCGGA